MAQSEPDIEALYQRYAPMVWRRCRTLLGSDQEATDAMQDVFVNLVKRESNLENRGLSSLLYTSATNLCLNRIRDRKKRGEVFDQDLLASIATSGDTEQSTGARLLLQKLFSSEKASSQTIATLHYVDGLTLEEVAATVDMSVSGVRKRLRLLRQKLVNMGVEL